MKKGLVIIGLLVVLAFLTGCSQESRAIDEAEKALLDVLKTPKTAEFCGKSEVSEHDEESGYYEIDGCVDAENGFGAMIRSDWTVEVYKVKGAQNEWVIEDVTIWEDIEDDLDWME